MNDPRVTVGYTDAGIARMNPDQGAQEAPADSELGQQAAQVETDYADDVAAADALYTRMQILAGTTRQAAIEAAARRRDDRLGLLSRTNQPSEVE